MKRPMKQKVQAALALAALLLAAACLGWAALAGLRAAVDALAQGRLDLGPLLTGPYPLEELGEALAATRDKPGGFVKAWVAL